MSWIASYIAQHLSAISSGNMIELGVLLAKDALFLYSILSFTVIIERVLNLGRTRVSEANGYRQLREAFDKNQMDAVRATALASAAPSVAALQAGLEHGSADAEIVREAIAQEVVVQTAELQRNLPMLATVASTAPYIGLFGTVLGILNAFQTIAATGKTGASVVAGGISEALLATALGLGVAIPAVIAYNYFNGKVNSLSLVVETHAIDLASRLPATQASTPIVTNMVSSTPVLTTTVAGDNHAAA